MTEGDSGFMFAGAGGTEMSFWPMKSVPESPEAPFPFSADWYAEFKANLEKLEAMTSLERAQSMEIAILEDKLKAITEANLRFKEQNVAQRAEIRRLKAENRSLMAEIRDLDADSEDLEDE